MHYKWTSSSQNSLNGHEANVVTEFVNLLFPKLKVYYIMYCYGITLSMASMCTDIPCLCPIISSSLWISSFHFNTPLVHMHHRSAILASAASNANHVLLGSRMVSLTLLVTVFNIAFGLVLCQSDCSTVQCPRPLCANPVLKPGECCLTCEDSNSYCKFHSCVNFNVSVDGCTMWAPQPCLIYQCDVEQNQPVCAMIDCVPTPTEAECLGYPIVRKLNRCWAECDFGILDDTCQIVEGKKTTNFDQNCPISKTMYVIHRCDQLQV